jgi:hypothetical protein
MERIRAERVGGDLVAMTGTEPCSRIVTYLGNSESGRCWVPPGLSISVIAQVFGLAALALEAGRKPPAVWRIGAQGRRDRTYRDRFDVGPLDQAHLIHQT